MLKQIPQRQKSSKQQVLEKKDDGQDHNVNQLVEYECKKKINFPKKKKPQHAFGFRSGGIGTTTGDFIILISSKNDCMIWFRHRHYTTLVIIE